MIKFRHYDNVITPGYGFAFLPGRRQPTLDIYIGKHVLVMFWKRNYEE